ncbi:hypothetical protein L226DRAFT_216756 [Lentinus tigrinus ALCF2SS1-7]|uniref:DUF6699 domain-containing protein n=1 Tax=Lentinus tigrinus ALCF2SS1-6 TaxID=1328759 RepID=A0A5C2S967_9APHY|nr:hypothetical protein L227DRAFT_611312 [Lentinus tigrinus ALCF2SS1-6]RPD70895.1 hypothetical protein L226DRAFT_216756 [Lentinus tigrinus ALCF2SS1-7]
MWARPYIDRPWGMFVHNATPLNPPRELSPPQVDAMIATLRDPDGTLHPERWVPRVEHPSLPPRPDLWPTPQVESLELPPEALQLNPFLQHKLVGRPPLHFDLRYRAADILLGAGGPEFGPTISMNVMSTSAGPSTSATAPFERRAPAALVDFYLDGPNGAQPATYPGVPSLKISALAGDPNPVFRWPVTVIAHHERLVVQVADVLHAVLANFEERMFQEEVDELSEDRQTIVAHAYKRRLRLPVGGVVPPEDDGLRRVDYLGDSTYFRGLAPAGDGDGFMLFLGPPP